MKPLTTFPEDFTLRLLPQVISDIDEKGLIRAVVGGWQDRQEELRALIDQYQGLIDPEKDQKISPNSLVITFTSLNGKTVRRHIYLNENVDPAKALLEDPEANSELLEPYADVVDVSAPSAYKDVLCRWAEKVFKLDDGCVSSVELGYNPRMAPLSPTLGLLAKTLGVMPLPDGIDPEIQRRLVRDQLQWARAKGTPRALSHRMYSLGFTDVLLTPLWSRLSTRKNDSIHSIGMDGRNIDIPAEFDLSGSPDTFPGQNDYDPDSYLDGPFYLWEQTCSLQDLANFFLNVNGASPFIQVSLHGFKTANHRRAWSKSSSYVQGDVVSYKGEVYIATGNPSGAPPSTGWAIIHVPDTGTYVLEGGAENVKAKVELLWTNEVDVQEFCGITVEAIAPGPAFNGLEVVVSDWVVLANESISNVETSSIVSLGSYPAGNLSLSYKYGSWKDGGGHYATRRNSGDPGYYVAVYYGQGESPIYFQEPEPSGPYSSPEAVFATCRDLSLAIDHPGGEVWLQFSDTSYGDNVNGNPPMTFSLESQELERRTLSVYARLSQVKYRSSHFDVIVALESDPEQPVQPNEALKIDPTVAWPDVAVSPFRPFGGPSGSQVSASVKQLNEGGLSQSAALATSAVEDWRPASRTPRRVEVGMVIQDSYRVAPHRRTTVLFQTDGSTSFSGTSIDPLPSAFPVILGIES